MVCKLAVSGSSSIELCLIGVPEPVSEPFRSLPSLLVDCACGSRVSYRPTVFISSNVITGRGSMAGTAEGERVGCAGASNVELVFACITEGPVTAEISVATVRSSLIGAAL